MTTAAELKEFLDEVLQDDFGLGRAVWQRSPSLLDYFIPVEHGGLPLSYREVADHVNDATGLALTTYDVLDFLDGWDGSPLPASRTNEATDPTTFYYLGMESRERWLMKEWRRPPCHACAAASSRIVLRSQT